MFLLPLFQSFPRLLHYSIHPNAIDTGKCYANKAVSYISKFNNVLWIFYTNSKIGAKKLVGENQCWWWISSELVGCKRFSINLTPLISELKPNVFIFLYRYLITLFNHRIYAKKLSLLRNSPRGEFVTLAVVVWKFLEMVLIQSLIIWGHPIFSFISRGLVEKTSFFKVKWAS